MLVNATWDTGSCKNTQLPTFFSYTKKLKLCKNTVSGLLYNFTVYFRRGAVRLPSDVYTMLIDYIIERNNLQVGQSGLYINPYQPNPFGSCYQNDCHPKGVCIDVGPNTYRCECGPGYRDLSPGDPGKFYVWIKCYVQLISTHSSPSLVFASNINCEYILQIFCAVPILWPTKIVR